jgi:hypothetical protein
MQLNILKSPIPEKSLECYQSQNDLFGSGFSKVLEIEVLKSKGSGLLTLKRTDITQLLNTLISEPTIYAWRKKFGDLETDEVRRLKTLEAENVRLRKMLV